MTGFIARQAHAQLQDRPTGAILLRPPQRVTPLSAESKQPTGAWIDYRRHAAYASLIEAANWIERWAALGVFGGFFLVVLAKRLVSYELIPAHVRKPRSLLGIYRLVADIVLRRTLRRAQAPVCAPDEALAPSIAADLRGNGCCVIGIGPADLQAIHIASERLF